MDTKIFDYLKTKRAVFEVRHYLGNKNQSGVRASLDSLDGQMEG